jgi:hypothetical protein
MTDGIHCGDCSGGCGSDVLGVGDDAGYGGRGGDTVMVVMCYGECRTYKTTSSSLP